MKEESPGASFGECQTFSRFLVVATPTDKWPHIVSEMMRVTRSGGYVEMVDMQQFPVTQSPAYNRVLSAAADMVKQREMQTGVEHTLKGYQGFSGCKSAPFRWAWAPSRGESSAY